MALPIRTSHRAACRLGVLLVVAAAGFPPSSLSAQGLTLRVAPESSTIRWDQAMGLKDGAFLGGGLSMGFGRFVLLKGAYGTAGTLNTAFGRAGFTAADGSSLDENQVKASLVSASVLLRMGNQRVAPVLSTRGGILDLEPEGREKTRQIMAAYGAGLDFRFTPWMDGQILLERMGNRLDRALLTPEGSPDAVDDDRAVTRNSLGVTASLGLRMGGSRASQRADDVDQGFGRLLEGNTEGLLVPLELQAGVVRFHESLGLADQRMVGVRSGVDLGPYFGIRGQYWRGVADGFDEFRDVSGWSGEVQFNVGKVTGASPHLILGAGQTRFADDFTNEAGAHPDNQKQLVVGAGLGLPVGDRARLVVSIRDYMTTAKELDDTSSPSDLRHSPSLTAGLSFLLFGPKEERAAPRPSLDSTDYRSGQVLAIPLPKEGEIYVRYGPGGRTLPGAGQAPGGAGPDSTAVALAVSEELTRLLGSGAATLSDSARAALEAGVRARLARLAEPSPVAVASPTAAPTTNVAPADSAGRPLAITPSGDPQVDDLRRQVAELTRLVRESMVLQAAGGLLRGGGAPVTVVTSEGVVLAEPETEPFLRAVEGRLGPGSMGSGNGGLGLRAEAYLSSLRGDDNLIPFALVELNRHGVSTDDGDRTSEGRASTLGMGFGVTAVLPNVGPLWPNVGALFAIGRVGTSGDTEADESPLDDRYGGLSMGPGLQVGVAYRPQPESRLFFAGALRKVWAGSTSRWSVEAGARLVFPRSGRRGGPFSLPSPVRTSVPSAGGGTGEGVAAPLDSLSARLAELEARLDQEMAARAAAEAEARDAQARADSLTREARVETAALAATAATRASWLQGLRQLAASSDVILRVEDGEDGVRITLGGALFPVGATAVPAGAAGDVRALAAALASGGVAEVRVEGHTDDTGAEESNLAISRLRAEAVAGLLVEGGLDAAATLAVGLGESRPVADNGTRAGRAENRRVEILVREAR